MKIKRTKGGFWNLILSCCLMSAAFLSVAGNTWAKEMPEEGSFLVDKNYDYYQRESVDAFLAYESENAYFYFEKQYYDSMTAEQKTAMENKIEKLGGEFDDVIYKNTRSIFGEEWNPGIDYSSKMVILLVRLDNNVGGYFNPNDEYPKERVVGDRSNENEIIYLNPDFFSAGKVEGFLAHEFQHMIYWNEKTRLMGVIDDTWLNEGRAELASAVIEDDLGRDFKNETLYVRKWNFLSNYTDSLIDWNNTNYDYSSVSMFMQYVRDHFGIGLFQKMNDNNKAGIYNLDYVLKADSGISLNKVFTNWTIANYLNDSGFNRDYGYTDDHLKTNFNVSPTLIYDKNNDDVINLTSKLKNWSADYYKIDLSKRTGDFYLSLDFDGEDAGDFTVPYVINYRNGSKEVGFMDLDYKSNGSKDIFFKAATADSIVFMPSSQTFESLSSGQVKIYSFELDAKYATTASIETHPDGTLVKLQNNEKVYVIEGGKKCWITDAAAFVSNGYDWEKIIVIDGLEMAVYPDGEDIKVKMVAITDNSLVSGDGPKVYLIQNNKKRWIWDAQTFIAYGFNWSKIIKVSEQQLAGYADGEDLIKSVFANGALIKGSSPKVYLIENGKKRWISSLAAFNRNNFKWSSVMQASDEAVASIPDGPVI